MTISLRKNLLFFFFSPDIAYKLEVKIFVDAVQGSVSSAASGYLISRIRFFFLKMGKFLKQEVLNFAILQLTGYFEMHRSGIFIYCFELNAIIFHHSIR